MSDRMRTIVGLVCALLALALSSLWFIGQERVPAGAITSSRPSRLYPGAWPPAARGLLWLAVGAAAVAFDLVLVRARAESQRGRDLAAAFAIVTGAAFLIFAIGSFSDAAWSVIY
ncbi:MAG: hypothetical protein ABR548_02450 [Actinomycetota bacterium]|nr:hypothetical protein [Actinomycetota bacterium]